MNAGKAVYGILSTNTEVTDIVSTRIYPEIAEQEAPVPFIVYQVQNVSPEDTHDGPSTLDEIRFEFLCYDATYNGAAELGDKVRGALDRVQGTYNTVNVQSVQFNDVDTEIIDEPRRYAQVLTFTFRIARDNFTIAQGTPVTGAMLGDLYDVNTTGVTDGQVIAYDAATAVWLPATDAGGAEQLNDLSDVIISQPAQGEFFRYDGGEWVNDTASKSDVGLGNVDNTSDANKPISTATQTALDLKADITSVPTELDDLNDVQIIGTPTLGQALVYGAGKWLPGAAGATDLGDLDDVNTTGAAFGSLLTYNGASWDISASELPADSIYFHQRYETESEALRTGATATTELYFTCTAQGNGLAESASSDTPTAGKIIRRKIYYSDAGFADPDTGTWIEFTPAPADDASFATVKAALLEYLKARTGGTVPISLKQTWEEVAAAPTFTGLLNETYGSGAAAAYGTRRLNGNYSGACMTIRRASDGTTQTIGFVGEEIDESAITNFCTGSTCTVQVWHDQSQTGGTGSGNDAEQTTPANQPTIYTGGALVKDGGRLALDFDGSNDWMSASGFGTGAERTVFNVLKGTADAASGYANYWIFLQTAPSTIGNFMQIYSADFDASFNGNFLTNGLDISATVGLQNQSLTTLLKSTSASNLYKDGVSIGSGSGTQSLEDELSIGRFDTNYAPQLQQEFVVYASDKSTDRTDIEGNISAYYQSAKLLDESYGSGAEAAYSVRQLKRDNTECMVIRRASDSTTTTIGFDGSGNISEADIESFCTGTTCTVYQWIDQSGNGNTATAPSTGAEPTIYTGGALVKDNGRVALDFDGDVLVIPNTTSLQIVGDLYFANVLTLESNGFSPFLTKRVNDNDREFEFRNTNSTQFSYLDSANKKDFSISATSSRQLYSINRISNSSVTFHLDGYSYSLLSLTGTQTASTADVAIGARVDLAQSFNGRMQEILLYDSNKSSNRTDIEENVGDYFTQNTPLLDTYSGAAAAYSLRLLDSTYTGSAIRVRRSSDNAEQDIGFNVFSELDTVSLLDFAGTGDAFVKVWYDQASTNDATQTTTANQPKIVSSGAVILENGKPAVEFVNASRYALELGSSVTPNHIILVSNPSTVQFQYTLNVLNGDVSHRLLNGDWMLDQTNSGNWFNENNGDSFINSSQVTGRPSANFHHIYFGWNTAPATSAFTAFSNTANVGGTNRAFDGPVQELIIYTNTDYTDSTNRTGIETNIATFYDITI